MFNILYRQKCFEFRNIAESVSNFETRFTVNIYFKFQYIIQNNPIFHDFPYVRNFRYDMHVLTVRTETVQKFSVTVGDVVDLPSERDERMD